jgi:hypothetical protein
MLPLMRWWVLVPIGVVACSNDLSVLVLPPPADGGHASDSAADALDLQKAVTVTVTLDGVPQPRVTVYFQNSALGPWIEARTDASGSVVAELRLESFHIASVTVLNPFGTIDAMTDELFTFNSVKVGDHLELARTLKPPSTMSFTLNAPVDSGATSYRLHTSCGAAIIAADPDGSRVGGAITLQGCGANVDMLVESLDPSGESRGGLYQPDVAVNDGTAVALTGSYQPSHVKTFSYETLSMRGPQLEIRSRLMTAKGIVYQSPLSVIPISHTDYHPLLSVRMPSIPGAIAITDTAYHSGMWGLEHTIDWGPDTDDYHLDLEPAGKMLRSYVTQPVFDGGTIRYTYNGGLVNADYLRAQITIDRFGGRTWRWHFVGSMGQFGDPERWPELPLSEYDTPGTARVDDSTLVYAPGGYDAIRARAYSLVSPLASITGPSGRIAYEEVLPR